jgi:ornithine cyclodeaminase
MRPFDEVRVAGREPAKAEALASALGAVAAESFEEAVRGADVVCATTHASEPVVRREWVKPGVHVTSVGFNPDGRELEPELVAAARVVVESRDSAFAPFPIGSNDLSGLDRDGVAEIGEILAGSRPGRQADDEITVYKSVGVAVLDVAAAALVLAAARDTDVGVQVDL